MLKAIVLSLAALTLASAATAGQAEYCESYKIGYNYGYNLSHPGKKARYVPDCPIMAENTTVRSDYSLGFQHGYLRGKFEF